MHRYAEAVWKISYYIDIKETKCNKVTTKEKKLKYSNLTIFCSI